jgi:hypothetical protein
VRHPRRGIFNYIARLHGFAERVVAVVVGAGHDAVQGLARRSSSPERRSKQFDLSLEPRSREPTWCEINLRSAGPAERKVDGSSEWRNARREEGLEPASEARRVAAQKLPQIFECDRSVRETVIEIRKGMVDLGSGS